MSMNVCLTYYVMCVSICVNNGCPSILVKNILKLKNKTITMARAKAYTPTREAYVPRRPVSSQLKPLSCTHPSICSWVVFAEFSQVNLSYIAAKFLCPFVRFESCKWKYGKKNRWFTSESPCMLTHARFPILASNFHPVQKSAMQIRQELWTEMGYPGDILVTSDQDISFFF